MTCGNVTHQPHEPQQKNSAVACLRVALAHGKMQASSFKYHITF